MASDQVIINGEIYRLRDDGTIYLGMHTWFRKTGTTRWMSTDYYGRAALDTDPEVTYEMRKFPINEQPSGSCTFFDRIRDLVANFV